MIEDLNTSQNAKGKQNILFTPTLGYHRPRIWVRFSKKFLIVIWLITVLYLASCQDSKGISQWKLKLDHNKSIYGRILTDKMNPWRKDIKKRSFLVRDWFFSFSTLLDRELVLPAFHFAISCEEDNSVCNSLLPSFKADDFHLVKGLPQYPESLVR
ncbi:hypothetical protein BY996DRAFT_6410545 [Phakopsora pachyrhizi]|nr:hypothetical protein BY996DRAFT_6410545 [Phakopsora pachyrhizi]